MVCPLCRPPFQDIAWLRWMRQINGGVCPACGCEELSLLCGKVDHHLLPMARVGDSITCASPIGDNIEEVRGA